tara:strand:- start:136 stop:1137 length:1002 start_codon:yes stop_codon:yes gene_type:complete
MKFRSKNLLVTGGAGFIGSNFIELILNKYKNVNIINLDLLTYAGNLDNTLSFKNFKNYKFIKGDICDYILLKEIFENYKVDGVINFAAESHVDNSIVNPGIFMRTNILGVYNLLKISYEKWMHCNFKYKSEFKHSRFHQISTDEVYGSNDEGSSKETDRHMPNSPYSASKSSADMIVRSFNKTYGLNTTITCSSNNFGPNQHSEKFIPKLINCLIKNYEIPLYGDGNNVRDWIYVKDNCDAIIKVYNKAENGEVYNIASNNELSNIEMINLFSKVLNVKPKIKFVPDRFGHDKRYSLSTQKIKDKLNWKSEFNFKEIIKNYALKQKKKIDENQ